MKKEELELKENKEINDNKKDENKNIIQKGLDIYKKYKEGINYLIFGGVVTVVNFIVYYIMSKIVHMDKIPSNMVAFVISVIVAYITNKKYVFESKTTGFKEVMKEFSSFMSSRIATGVFCDIIIFGVMAEIIGINDIISKIVSQVVVVISNYIIGKYFVFSDGDGKKDFLFSLQKKNFKYTTGIISFTLAAITTYIMNVKIDLNADKYIYSQRGLTLLVLTIIIIYNAYKIIFKKQKNKKDVSRIKLYSQIAGMLFAFMLTIGEFTEEVFFDAKIVISNKILFLIIFKYIAYYIIMKNLGIIIFNYLDKKNCEKYEHNENNEYNEYNEYDNEKADKKRKKENKKRKFKFLDASNTSFIVTTIILLFCYLPMFLANYPGIVSADNSLQIIQMKSNYYTNGHPIVHTYIFSHIVELGKNMFGTYTNGVALYTVIHMILYCITISYVLKYLAKKNVPYIIRVVIFAIAALYPPVANHAIILNKDIIFTVALTYLVIELVEMSFDIRNYFVNYKNAVKLSLIIFLTLFLRHNAFYAYLVAIVLIPLLLYGENRKNKKLGNEKYIPNMKKYISGVLIIFLVPMITYNIAIGAIIKYGKVEPGTTREKLTILSQVLARNAKYNRDELSESEKEAILGLYNSDMIKDLDQVAKLYNPSLSDELKNSILVDKDTKKKEVVKTFLKLIYEQPLDSMQAFFSQTHIYYYPVKENIYLPSSGVSNYCFPGHEKYKEMLDLHQDPKIFKTKNNVNNTEKENEEKYIHDLYYGKVPVISILTVIGYIIYALIFNVLYLFYSRRYAEVIPHIIWFGIFITCLLSPVNGEIRYILPAFMSVYILIPMLFRRKYKIKD